MTKGIRYGMIALAGLPLLASSCMGAADDASAEVEVQTSALTVTNALNENGFTTAYNAQVAVGAATDHILAVWTAKSSANVPQIVGQPFDTASGGVFGFKSDKKLLAFSDTSRPKSFPALSWDNNANVFLVVWQDDYTSSDSDIWGAIVNDQGDINTGPFFINFDSDVEKMPTVTYVSAFDAFIVTYTRKIVSTGRVALTSQFVSPGGTVGTSLVDVVSSGVSQTGSPPTTAFVANQGMIMFTWNDNQYGWGPIENPVLSVSGSVSGGQGLVTTGNATPGADSYGIAWRTGTGTSAKILAQVFPNGCQAPGCAQPAVTAFTAGSGINNLHNPVISAAHLGYGVFVGTEESTWHIKYKEIGAASGSITSVTPNCAAPGLQSVGGHSLGSSGGVIAVATPPNTINQAGIRQYLLYDSFCGATGSPKEMVQAPNPDNTADVLGFNVSMN